MTFINLSKKYVFLATARCASTSCYEELENISKINNEDYITHNTENPDLYHMGLQDFLDNYPQFDDFYVFATIRNPITRFVSSWNEFGKKGHQSWAYEIQRFNSIEQFIDNFDQTKVKHSIHFRPQFYQLNTSKKRTVDKILRFENLGKDFSDLTYRLYGSYYSLNSFFRPTSKSLFSSKDSLRLRSFINNYYKVDVQNYYRDF